MDQHILNQARVAYFLGNYSKVMDLWQSTEKEDEYFNFVVARALMAQRELKPKSTFQLTKKPSQQLLEITDLVTKFLAPMLKPARPNTSVDEDRKIIEEAFKLIKEQFDQNSNYHRLMKIICCYLSINACEVQYVFQQVSSQNDATSAEIKFLQLLCYLRGRRQDLAEQSLIELKKFDDEDILTYLGQIYTHIYNGDSAESKRAITETKERFGESAKLMNLMVNALIAQNKFEEAFELASNLQQALIEKDYFSDRIEIETCLSNLIVLSEICNKTTVRDECMQALTAINPGSLLIKNFQQKQQIVENDFK